MNTEWQTFLEAVPWFLTPGQAHRVSATNPPGSWKAKSAEFNRLFPQLALLLSAAHTTEVLVDDRRLVLFTWGSSASENRSWLSPEPSMAPLLTLLPEHQLLLQSFGGIVERANEPCDNWLLNHNEALTEQQATGDASFIQDIAWAFENADTKIPIDIATYYPIAVESNGNCTLCNRYTGEILLFAPDHDFKHVHSLPGSPEYTLYIIEGASHFAEWVNAVGQQWLKSG